jgi:hypothetical protein
MRGTITFRWPLATVVVAAGLIVSPAASASTPSPPSAAALLQAFHMTAADFQARSNGVTVQQFVDQASELSRGVQPPSNPLPNPSDPATQSAATSATTASMRHRRKAHAAAGLECTAYGARNYTSLGNGGYDYGAGFLDECNFQVSFVCNNAVDVNGYPSGYGDGNGVTDCSSGAWNGAAPWGTPGDMWAYDTGYWAGGWLPTPGCAIDGQFESCYYYGPYAVGYYDGPWYWPPYTG